MAMHHCLVSILSLLPLPAGSRNRRSDASTTCVFVTCMFRCLLDSIIRLYGVMPFFFFFPARVKLKVEFWAAFSLSINDFIVELIKLDSV